MSYRKRSGWAVAASAVVLGVFAWSTPVARADTVLKQDLNNIATSASGVTAATPFSELYTGTIMVDEDGDSALMVFVTPPGGFAQDQFNTTSSSPTFELDGSIDLVAGVVQGGDFSVSLSNGDLFTADIDPFSGNVERNGANQFSVDGRIANGEFNGDTFGSVDVSEFNDNEPLFGDFLEFEFNPNSSGFDSTSSLDINIAVPTPTAALAGVPAMLVFGLLTGRRRRKAAARQTA